jgi:hypothetical protein
MVSLSSLIFSLVIFRCCEADRRVYSLEEPTDDSDIAIVAILLANGSDFVESERRIEPKDPT